MATTAGGTYYAASSEAVSGFPAISLNLANQIESRLDAKADNSPPVNAQTGTTYTVATTDLGKTITCSNASPVTVTVNTGLSSLATGSIIRIINLGAGLVTVAPSGTTIAGSPLTLAQYKGASIIKTGTNAYVMLPFSGASPATVSSTTGSPTTGANGSKTYYKWTGSGSVTLGSGGTFDALIQAGGGGGNLGGGGAGQLLYVTSVYLAAGTYTVTVGAGGAAGTVGGLSLVGTGLIAVGGGAGAANTIAGGVGGNGGGGGGSGVGGASIAGGFAGGNGLAGTLSHGGGGGTSAVGVNGATNAGGNGGAGTSKSITGAAVTYGGGGGGGTNAGTIGAGGAGGGGNGSTTTGVAGTANTGGGGGGGPTAGGIGGSGVVILLIG